MIAVIGPPGDQEVDAVYSRLRNRGADACIVDLSRFPGDAALTIGREYTGLNGIDIAGIESAYLRRRGATAPWYIDYEKSTTVESEDEWRGLYRDYIGFIENEKKHLAVKTAFINLIAQKGVLVNPIRRNDLHRMKTYLYRFLKTGGQRLPAFMAGSDKMTLKDFAEKAFAEDDGVVSKPLAGIYKTHLWNTDMWKTHAWNRRGALYQRYIRGDTIRCYVLGGKLIAAARIVHGGTVDSSMSQTGIEVIALPDAARRIAESAAESLELSFCGMDLMRHGETGEFFLIDCNMSPMFVNFARLSGIDIPALLAGFLIEQSGKKRKKKTLSLLDEAKDILARDPEIRKRLFGR
ncbi:MAG: hypothetical protein JW881_04545 [Spirochaetales bacterium]|nr:hypothetical protein [Spirochaetales bacterium]